MPYAMAQMCLLQVLWNILKKLVFTQVIQLVLCHRKTFQMGCWLQSESRQTALARALNVIGLMNVQFAVKDEIVYLLEVNPRGFRTVPFVAKATGLIAKIASRVMAGEKLVF